MVRNHPHFNPPEGEDGRMLDILERPTVRILAPQEVVKAGIGPNIFVEEISLLPSSQVVETSFVDELIEVQA